MARRDISKTAIEGGRANHSRYEERQTTRAERRQEKVRLNRVLFDRDYADEVLIEHRETFVPWIDKDFDDKLSPVKRWLESKVGRKWDDVYSEVRKTFDFRTTAGRHIAGHIEGFVTMPWDVYKYGYRGSRRHFPGELYVDDDGVLCQTPHESKKSWYRRS